MATTGAVAATPAAKMTERQQLAIALRESMSAAATPVTAGGTSARAEASPDGEPLAEARAEEPKRRKLTRVQKELASLAPWAWDPLVSRHAPGASMMRDFTEVVADKTVTTNTTSYTFKGTTVSGGVELPGSPVAPATAAKATPRGFNNFDAKGGAGAGARPRTATPPTAAGASTPPSAVAVGAAKYPRVLSNSGGVLKTPALASSLQREKKKREKKKKHRLSVGSGGGSPGGSPGGSVDGDGDGDARNLVAELERAVSPVSPTASEEGEHARASVRVARREKAEREERETATARRESEEREKARAKREKAAEKAKEKEKAAAEKAAASAATKEKIAKEKARRTSGGVVKDREPSAAGGDDKENVKPLPAGKDANVSRPPRGAATTAPRSHHRRPRAPPAPAAAAVADRRGSNSRAAALLAVAAAEAAFDAEKSSGARRTTASQHLLAMYYKLSGREGGEADEADDDEDDDDDSEDDALAAAPAPGPTRDVMPRQFHVSASSAAPSFFDATSCGPFRGAEMTKPEDFARYHAQPQRVVSLTNTLARACAYVNEVDARVEVGGGEHI